MSKALQNNRASKVARAAICLAAGVVLCVALKPATAEAVTPLIMGPAYEEPARTSANPAPPSANGCPVEIVELTDTRRAPQSFGSFATLRAIEGPADRDAWLHSVFQVGLTARGFTPSFAVASEAPAAADPAAVATADATPAPSEVAADATPVAAPGIVVAHVNVRAIWVTTVQMNKTASVVFRARIGSGADEIYRGDKISLNMWGSQSEFNGILNQVFADALDDFAANLRSQCPSTRPAAN